MAKLPMNQPQASAAPGSGDAISLLEHDHREVESLFEQFENARNRRSWTSIVGKICDELELHAKVEEKIFYPAAKEEGDDLDDTVNEGIVEHAAVKRLVRELRGMQASDEFYRPKVTVLKEFVKHHVKEEETEMFPKLRNSGLDLQELGDRITRMKARAR